MIKLIKVIEDENIMFCSVQDDNLSKNINLIVDTERGLSYVKTVSNVKEYDEKDVPNEVCTFVRVATEKDDKTYERNKVDAAKAKKEAIRIQNKLKLDMKIIEARYTFDRKQLLFIFLADGRVDFRDLVKQLALIYRVRIELRQIGVRDKAKSVGGIGPCGRFLCCNTFLNDFNSVSINMAKNQYIALNPTKINGVCGRLLCCLNYEDEQYTEMKKNLPKVGSKVDINGVQGRINSINIFLNTAIIETKNKIFVEVDLGDYDGSTK